MKLSRSLRLTCCVLLAAFATAVCSSGYITPGSLSETEEAGQAISASATRLAELLATSTAELGTATTPFPTAEATTAPLESATPAAPYLYTAQSGDTLAALASRFGVNPTDIASPQDIPPGLINAGQIFNIPNVLGATTPNERLIPDSEVIYSPSAIGFNTASYAGPFAGYLMSYREYLPSDWHSGTAVIERVALEHSINPRLLLSVLQYQSNWVLGEPKQGSNPDYPMGYIDPSTRGLYAQLSWATNQLSLGYYGWREGRLTELTFKDGTTMRIAPDLNAGTVAIQYLFSQLYDYEGWLAVMDKDAGFAYTHSKAMFPDPAVRASQTEPLFPPDLTQPHMSLPFYGNAVWSFTSGPHGAWERDGAQAALDFAPSSSETGCADSEQWIAAAAPGLVVRTGTGIVVVDMDGDGYEQTGWVIFYLHVTNKEHIHVGDWVDRGDRLGNPSCVGGDATGTHLHIARKYNGEWIGAAGPLPFDLSGWVSQSGGASYLGTLVRNGVAVTACTCSNAETRISHTDQDPY